LINIKNHFEKHNYTAKWTLIFAQWGFAFCSRTQVKTLFKISNNNAFYHGNIIFSIIFIKTWPSFFKVSRIEIFLSMIWTLFFYFFLRAELRFCWIWLIYFKLIELNHNFAQLSFDIQPSNQGKRHDKVLGRL
jgi:hypothetical protein